MSSSEGIESKYISGVINEESLKIVLKALCGEVRCGEGETKELVEKYEAKGTAFLKIYAKNELVKGAKVYIDGKEAGEIEGDMFSVEVESGEHEVLITSGKIEDIRFKFKVGEYEEYKMDVMAKPATRVLKIITDPPNAKVYVDGEYVGETPKFLKVEVGKSVDIRMEKEEYKVLKKKTKIPEKGSVVVKEYELEKVGVLKVRTEPEGASVYIDGEYVGKSPVEVEFGRNKEVNVKVEKKGYKVEERKIEVYLGKVEELSIVLVKKPPRIIWQKTLGGSDLDLVNSVIQTEDGGYLVVGGTKSNDGDVKGYHGREDIWVVKLGY